MRSLIGLIAGMVLLVLGAQGGIRMLADHDNAGLLAWVPGGFGIRLACYAAAAVAGLLLAGWGGRRTSPPAP